MKQNEDGSYLERAKKLMERSEHDDKVKIENPALAIRTLRFIERYGPRLHEDDNVAFALLRMVLGGAGVDALNYRLAQEISTAEAAVRQIVA